MCGIAGLVLGSGAADRGDRAVVERMLEAIAHRGPDESRAEARDAAVLGTARLALVDRPTSQQPFGDPSGRYLLAFNGEIYNFRELRRDLEPLGVEFRTTGDTEVLLHVLIQHGRAGLSLLKGQFAVAFWDREAETLLLARDRTGIVPLFWTVEGRTWTFASEVKALKAAGRSVALSIPDLVDGGVLWGLHPGRSAFAGVQSVEPGGFVLRGPDGEVEVGRYWQFAFAEERDRASVDDHADRLGGLLSQAVARRVPQYGDPAVLLSGGLDSSAVLAILRRAHPEGRIDSYSIQFASTALDEAPFQALASEAFGTDHTAIVCDDERVASALVEAVVHAEQPLSRTAPASSIGLAATIEQHGTRAVLSGEGADELFCGYDLFKVAAIRDAWSADPGSTELPAMLEQALQQQADLGRSVERAFYEQGLETRGDPLFSHLNRWSSSFRITQYLTPELRAGYDLETVLDGVRARLPEAYLGWSAVEQAQYLEAAYFLPTTLLASQCDRPYMAHSIEARYPFLDEDVIDFALTLPESSKLVGLREKIVVKLAVRDWVPQPIRDRVKQPYTAPEGDVFRSGPGRALLAEYVAPDALNRTGLFDPKRVDWLLRKLERGRTSFHDDLALLWVFSTQVLATTYGTAD